MFFVFGKKWKYKIEFKLISDLTNSQNLVTLIPTNSQKRRREQVVARETYRKQPVDERRKGSLL